MVTTVIFLFTDIEGSTQLWERHQQAMQAPLARHDALLRQAVAAHSGQIVKMTGDGCHAAFTSALEGALAALQAQQALAAETWPEIAPHALRVRMGLYAGEAEARAGDYYGSSVNRAARLMSVAHGGQILISQVAADLLRDRLPIDAALRDLGEHHLKDLTRPERILQLTAPGLRADFPPIKSLDAFGHNLPIQLTRFIGREREVAEIKRLLGTSALLTLTGSGGTGKTRLSLQAAADLLPDFADGAWLVEQAPLADPALVVQTIAVTLGLRDPLADALADFLRSKQLLLLLDNCEHLIAACAREADRLLHQCPQLKIIASSREALGIAGETTYPVPSLSLPDPRPELATLFIRANYRRELAVIHSPRTPETTIRWKINAYVEPTHTIRQEPVGACVICRQPTLSPTDRTRPSEHGDGHSGRSPAQPRETARRKRSVAATIDCPTPQHENTQADVAGTLVAVVPRALGSQLETSPPDHPATHPAALAPRGVSAVLPCFGG